MATVEQLITDNLDIWSSAMKAKSAAGRGTSKKIDLYGIKKLREFILDLAVRGLLVPQDPNDEPASKLLKKITIEKTKLIKDGKIKKQKPTSPFSDEEKLFKVPKNWSWQRLGEIGEIFNGNSINASVKESKYTNISGIPFIATKDVGYGFEELDYKNGISIPAGEDKFKIAKKGSILICAEGGSAGKKCGIAVKDIYFGNKLFANVLYGSIEPKYILSLYLSPSFFERLSESMTGIIGGISRAKFMALPAPIPPLNEQRRIVAKIDELMALCDQLEQQTETSISAHKTLVQTLLEALTNTSERDGFTQAWIRITEHFDTLFTTEWSIDQLKQTILQLAVIGKLIPQNPNDEPATELLTKIAAEKEKLIEEGKIKKQKPLSVISEIEKPFELPAGWDFAHMQDLCTLITDGTHQTPKYSKIGRPFISAQCVKPFRFLPENCRYVSEEHYQGYIKNRKPEFRDILLARVGAGIGEAAVIDTDLEFAIYVSTGLLKPHHDFLLSEYLVIWLNSPVGRNYSETNTLGKGVSQGNLNLSLIRAFVVSVPPINEQRHIVTKVDELMALCDTLKNRINNMQITQLHLADAMAEQALN